MASIQQLINKYREKLQPVSNVLSNVGQQLKAHPEYSRQISAPYVKPINQFLNKPAPNNLLTRGLVSAAKPLAQPLNKYGEGFAEASTYGLYEMPQTKSGNLGEKIGY